MELRLRELVHAGLHEPQAGPLASLATVWGEELDPAHVLEEHPRPQLARSRWASLNGWWEYAFVSSGRADEAWRNAKPPERLDGRILVPFSPEASLSGVRRQLQPDELLWYHLHVDVALPLGGERLVWHLDGVDYCCACYAGGRRVGEHRGAYEPFAFDVTDCIDGTSLDLAVCVWDPSDAGTQPRGKQRLERGKVWYTAQSGIWQPSWLELVPTAHVRRLHLVPDADSGVLVVTADVTRAGHELVVELLDGEDVVAMGSATAGGARCSVTLAVEEPRLWSVDDPHLYGLRVRYGDDLVASYCAFRTVGVERDARGVSRFCLNHEPLFLRGLLDQGYWPDGLLTAPADAALEHDVRMAKDAGFNLLRLHLKVERERFYYHCDRLGMLVLQDMPQGGSGMRPWDMSRKPTLFRHLRHSVRDDVPSGWRRLGAESETYRREWTATCRSAVDRLANHPCIMGWLLFNEAWGQFSSADAARMVEGLDPTRPVVAVSGWYDQGAGSFLATHIYFRRLGVWRDLRRLGGSRAYLISEFGGLDWHVEGHSTCERGYGYGEFDTPEAWREGLRELLSQADALEEKGCSGWVYTQLSDVEEETNGLLTYDRKVNKLEAG